MSELRASYSRWKRGDDGKILIEYMIYGFGGPYEFPSKEKIDQIADETFLRAEQTPRDIRIHDDSAILFFAQKVFRSKKDRVARERFFNKFIAMSKKA
jgi:hypothetical protein